MKKIRSYVFLKIKTVKKEKGQRGEKKRVVVSRMSSACCADRVSTRGEVEEKKKKARVLGHTAERRVKKAKRGLTIILAALTKMADRCCPPSSVVGQPEFPTQTL